MCSTTRGPAIWPSLVTWPTRTTAAPVCLAKRIIACAPVRTCVTVPGADSAMSLHSVWIEIDDDEVRARPLRRAWRGCPRHWSRPPGGRRCPPRRGAGRAAAPARRLPRRRRRSRGCRCRERAAAACISSVDLPMPGSPPTRIAEPRTKPPPVARSSSAMPVSMRGASSISPESDVSATARPFFGVLPGPPPMPPAGSSSTMVFHSPQASHLPAQRLWTVPQFWQTNWVRDLAMPAGLLLANQPLTMRR